MSDVADAYAQLRAAISFAARAHQGQRRKDRITPYVAHPFRVATIVATVFGETDPDTLTAAVLHDTIEDTTVDYDDLEEAFGKRIADWVSLLSKDPRLPFERREELYRQALGQAPWQVQLCKLADIYDNLTDLRTSRAAGVRKSLEKIEAYLKILEETGHPQTQDARSKTRALLQHVAATLEDADSE